MFNSFTVEAIVFDGTPWTPFPEVARVASGPYVEGLLRDALSPVDAHWAGGMRNRKIVVEVLHASPQLEQLLCDVQDRLLHLFAGSRLVLEGDANGEQLYVIVETTLDADAARTALERFDREWWLERMVSARGMVSVVLSLV